jgi:hypothetical protein
LLSMSEVLGSIPSPPKKGMLVTCLAL